MRIALSALLAAAFLASGCAMMSPKTPASISAADAGSAILLHPGQDLQLTLVSNHTTGYRWVWANPVNPVLAQVGKPGFKPSEAAKDGTVGVVGKRGQTGANGGKIIMLAQAAITGRRAYIAPFIDAGGSLGAPAQFRSFPRGRA